MKKFYALMLGVALCPLALGCSDSTKKAQEDALKKSADDVKANLVAKAEADVAEQRAKAAADIEAAKAQAVADLRGEVTNLAIGAAEQVVGQSLNDDSRRALVEAYIDQVGAGR